MLLNLLSISSYLTIVFIYVHWNLGIKLRIYSESLIHLTVNNQVIIKLCFSGVGPNGRFVKKMRISTDICVNFGK